MYAITRKSKISETLELRDLKGKAIHTIVVDIDLDGFISKYNKCREAILIAQSEASKVPDNTIAVEAYGNAIINMMKLVFGDENANTIIDFYENKYSEMMVDVFPFIIEVIQPQIEKASKERVEQFKKMARKVK